MKKLVVIDDGNVGLTAALLQTLAASSVEAIIVVEPVTDWSDPSTDVIGGINRLMDDVRRKGIDLQHHPPSIGSTMVELKAIDRRHMYVQDVVIDEPKQPNFSRFQNQNFKRRGR